MRRAAKVDRNQPLVVEALRKAGWTVRHTHMIGKGWPDVVAAKQHINLLVEIKMPGEKLTPDEAAFWNQWPGPKIIAYSEQDAVDKAAQLHTGGWRTRYDQQGDYTDEERQADLRIETAADRGRD